MATKPINRFTVEEAKKEISIEDAIDNVIEDLKNQKQHYREKAEYFRTMSIKAEGALEVLSQLEKDKDE